MTTTVQQQRKPLDAGVKCLGDTRRFNNDGLSRTLLFDQPFFPRLLPLALGPRHGTFETAVAQVGAQVRKLGEGPKATESQEVVNSQECTPAVKSSEMELLKEFHLFRRDGAVLVIDVVASVNRIAEDEAGFVAQWVDFTNRIASHILPAHEGRLVKSLGDGLLIELADLRASASVARAILKLTAQFHDPKPLSIRMGIDVGSFIVGATDIYGHSVNMAARLAAAAAPGDIMLSERVRDRLAEALDVDVEDMGLRQLKHVAGAQRVYRLMTTEATHKPRVTFGFTDLKPAIAIVPLMAVSDDGLSAPAGIMGLGDIICEELIRCLGPSGLVHIISRLSTSQFRTRTEFPGLIGTRLAARYVLTGTCCQRGDAVVIRLRLHDGISHAIIWEGDGFLPLDALLGGSMNSGQSGSGIRDGIDRLAAEVARAIVNKATLTARTKALPTIESHVLLMAAIALLNHQRRDDFALSRKLLETLIERAPQAAVPQAWLAQWYNLLIQQGWSDDPEADGKAALVACEKALNLDPESSLALSVAGLVHTTLWRNESEARRMLDAAVISNPNEPMAWLYDGVNRMFKGDGGQAILSTRRACALSPLDPSRYLFETIAASAAYVGERYAEALRLSESAIHMNQTHVSSHRVRVVSLSALERGDEARAAGRELLQLEPGLTVSKWRERSPAAPHVIQRFADALLDAGIPE